MISDARKASSKLNGMAKVSSPKGSTPILPITTHIITKPTNQENKVVCTSENFRDRMKMVNAKSNDHKPQTAPLTGSEGNVIPSDS